jgi:hypothetical protein
VGSWAACRPGENISPPTTRGAWIMGGLWVSHRREDVACNVASAGTSCFQLSLPASDFLLPTFTSCFRLPASAFVSHRRGYGRRCRPGRKHFAPYNVGVRGSWVDCGCPTGVKTLRATSHRQELPASNFHFLLPPSCFRLRLPTGVGYGGGAARGETFRPLQRGVRGSWVDCGCPTGVKTLRATSLHGIHSSHVYFLLPPSCFRLRLPTGVLPGAKTFRPYNVGCADHGWIVGAPPA